MVRYRLHGAFFLRDVGKFGSDRLISSTNEVPDAVSMTSLTNLRLIDRIASVTLVHRPIMMYYLKNAQVVSNSGPGPVVFQVMARGSMANGPSS